VTDAPVTKFDESGLGLETGNIAAIESLRVYRTLRFGRDIELIITDNRSFRAQPVLDSPEAAPFQVKDFPYFVSQDVVEILDAGRSYQGGRAPRTIRFGGADVANPRRDAPAQSMLGAVQKKWFLGRLRSSTACWKLWGNSVGSLDWRTDLQNIPADVGPRWPSDSYGTLGDDDWSGYRSERAEILGALARDGITGVVSIAGDRHSFQAGVLSRSLPPEPFEPVAVEFVTGSVSAPGLAEAAEYKVPKDHPLRALYLYQAPGQARLEPAMNVSLVHGVRSSLILQATGDRRQALAARNSDVAPHLSFMDVGGHGYSVVRTDADALEVEFVCVPRPLEPSGRAHGGPIAYRVAHRVRRWTASMRPCVERTKLEGAPPLFIQGRTGRSRGGGPRSKSTEPIRFIESLFKIPDKKNTTK
jgi:alkaline phosphatase D